ncbi:MAG: HIT family protein [Devosiaceae bacterium]|nr:HIT family protein [Devosiaceae bacterium MH13]
MATYDPTNIFAKILAGEMPSHAILETDETLAIMDVMPQADGHALILPRAPSRNLLDADPAVFAPLMRDAQKVARAAMQAFGADGVVIQQFNEAPAGQTVFHLHVHVIPRIEGVGLRAHGGSMADPDVLAKHAQLYREALAAMG